MNSTASHSPSLPPPQTNKNTWPWVLPANTEPPTGLSATLPLPKVSIITPSYQQAAYLEETIRSVLLQGYPNLEYIVIDGGSTDGSCDIIQKYAPWIDYWVSEKDAGQSDAINKGWRRATGHIFAWLNSDDMYLPGAIWAAVEVFLNHPEYGMVFGDTILVDKAGEKLGDDRQYSDGKPHNLRPGQRIPPAINQPATFYRASVLEKVGLLDSSLNYCMDYDLFLRIAKVSSLAYIPRQQAKMRLYAAAKTYRDIRKNWQEKLAVHKRYDSHWWLSKLWMKYLVYSLWSSLPPGLQTTIRSLRRSTSDIILLTHED